MLIRTFKAKGLHIPVTLVEYLVCLSTNLVPALEMGRTWDFLGASMFSIIHRIDAYRWTDRLTHQQECISAKNAIFLLQMLFSTCKSCILKKTSHRGWNCLSWKYGITVLNVSSCLQTATVVDTHKWLHI